MVAPVNFVAVSVAALSTIVVGSLWYGPLFGKPWMKLMGWSKEQMDAMKKDPAFQKKMKHAYVLSIVNGVITSFVMSQLLAYHTAFTGLTGVNLALTTSLFLWLAFAVPVSMSDVLWGKGTWMLWRINVLHYLVQYSVIALMLSLWV